MKYVIGPTHDAMVDMLITEFKTGIKFEHAWWLGAEDGTTVEGE
jgi:hypothetical protein